MVSVQGGRPTDVPAGNRCRSAISAMRHNSVRIASGSNVVASASDTMPVRELSVPFAPQGYGFWFGSLRQNQLREGGTSAIGATNSGAGQNGQS